MKHQLQDALFVTIQSAINGQQVIQFEINNTWRTVEPYQLGIQKGENILALYGYCWDVVSDALTPSRWQVFPLKAIKQIELTNYSFLPHVEYSGQAELMAPVFCKLLPSHIGIDFLPIHGPYSTKKWAMLKGYSMSMKDSVFFSVN